MSGIVIARRPFRFTIIDVLPICRCAERITPSSVVPRAVGHALGVGVRHLILQAVAHLLLENRLQRVVSHGSVRLGSTSDRRNRVQKCWVFGKEWARSSTRRGPAR